MVKFLQYQKLYSDAYDLEKKYENAAGYDIKASSDYTVKANCNKTIINTGLIIKPPKGYYCRIASRSGLAFNKNIHVMAGTIDEDYRGELAVLLINLSCEDYIVRKGDRIAQIICEKNAYPKAIQVNFIKNDTQRGAKGFGSTGF